MAKRYSPPQILRVQKSAWKFSTQFFWDNLFILHIDFISKSQTVNAEYYSSLLVQLKNSLKENLHVKFGIGILFSHDKVRFTKQLHNRNILAYLFFHFPTLFSVSDPIGIPRAPLTGYNKRKFRHFSSYKEVITAAVSWFNGQSSEFI